MRFVALLALIGACVYGCSIPEGPEPGKTYLLEPSGAWSDAELSELATACDDWRAWSDGALDCRIGTPGDASIVRGPTGGPKLGHIDTANGALVVDADGLATAGFPLADGVRAMTENLIGRAAGMPSHDGPGVLATDDVRPVFTEADRASCRAAGFCR